MKLLKEFIACLRGMEKVSKVILWVGYGLFTGALLAAGAVLLFYSARGDFTTGLYWCTQCLYMGKETLGASAVPVLLFELLLIGRGLKAASPK